MILSLFLRASVNVLVLAVPTAEFINNMEQSLVWAVWMQKGELVDNGNWTCYFLNSYGCDLHIFISDMLLCLK